MKKLNVEFFVGLFVIAGLMAISFMAIRMGDLSFWSQTDKYQLQGRFTSVSGLKEGAAVEMAGVKVGKVSQIQFDPDRFEAVVTMDIPNHVQLSTDSMASIRTTGIIGDKYIKITVGGEEDTLQPGGQFEQTESSLDIEELISKFVFNSQKEE